jgi:hypothetical protein
MSTPITAQLLKGSRRAQHVAKLFGARFLWIESFVFDTAGSVSEQYEGGHWDYYTLSNGGFYMAPASLPRFRVVCANGFAGEMSSDALGITTCMYAYSFLSFSPDEKFAQLCADHFLLLRAFAVQHAEANLILSATD